MQEKAIGVDVLQNKIFPAFKKAYPGDDSLEKAFSAKDAKAAQICFDRVSKEAETTESAERVSYCWQAATAAESICLLLDPAASIEEVKEAVADIRIIN